MSLMLCNQKGVIAVYSGETSLLVERSVIRILRVCFLEGAIRCVEKRYSMHTVLRMFGCFFADDVSWLKHMNGTCLSRRHSINDHLIQ